MSELRPRERGAARVPGIARHGRLKKSSPWSTIFAVLASTVAVVLVASVSVVAIQTSALVTIAEKNSVDIHPGEEVALPPTVGAYPGGFNMLIVGSDTRVGQGGIGGGDAGDTSTLNDVTMLLHVSGDHKSATAVSIPRDMVVPIPACAAGGPATGLPINNALYYGGSTAAEPGKGLPCAVKTVENLTGLKIQFAGLITFRGVIAMSNAVGGVDVCVTGPVVDTDTGINLPKAGTYKLKGSVALAFLRSRHGVGDGSDLGRISSQQVYLSSLVRELKSNDTLSNIPKLYSIATAAVNNMQLSTSLNSLETLIAIAQSLKDVPLDQVVFVQYPGALGLGGIYEGKVAPVTAKADALFALIKADKPFKLTNNTNGITSVENTAKPTKTKTPTATKTPTSTETPKATKTPKPSSVGVLDGVLGQTAGDETCAKAN